MLKGEDCASMVGTTIMLTGQVRWSKPWPHQRVKHHDKIKFFLCWSIKICKWNVWWRFIHDRSQLQLWRTHWPLVCLFTLGRCLYGRLHLFTPIVKQIISLPQKEFKFWFMKVAIKFLLTVTILSWLLVMQLVNNIPALPFVSYFVTWTFLAACCI
jgi:hypothetical protein